MFLTLVSKQRSSSTKNVHLLKVCTLKSSEMSLFLHQNRFGEMYHLLTIGCTPVNGCRQNESPNKRIPQEKLSCMFVINKSIASYNLK